MEQRKVANLFRCLSECVSEIHVGRHSDLCNEILSIQFADHSEVNFLQNHEFLHISR